MAVRAVLRKACRHGIALSALALALPTFAYADYYYPNYSGYGYYGGYGGSESNSDPVISIDMDPKHQIDSAFRVSAREGRINDMMALVRQGADINSVSDEGNSALMYASRNCSVEVAGELLRMRANANIRNKEGDTALILASMESCLPVVKLLLKNPRLDLLARDRDGKTAVDYARDGAVLEVDGPEEQILRLILSRAPEELAEPYEIRQTRADPRIRLRDGNGKEIGKGSASS